MKQSRRSFLKTQLALGACMTAGLDVISAPVQAADLSGYKALVCVYLAGGNDSYNMFVPFNASAHADYAAARRFVALPRNQILPIEPATYSDGQAYGFHPSMTQCQNLFGSGDLAVLANVGTLVRPLTKQQYENRAAELPKQLFSHNDQTDSWLAANARGTNGVGWAGQTMDLMYPNGAPQPSPSISIGGNTLWQTGRRVRSFEVGTNGVGSQYLPFHRGPVKLRDTFRLLHQADLQNPNALAKEHAETLDRAEAFGNSINTALESAPEFQFPQGRLADQLKMVANLIAVRDRLDANMNRQVFFVRIGGWDTHDNQVSGDNKHANLLRQVDLGLAAFHNAITSLNVQDSVTCFTATEFGRTVIPNGSGTDHGWGGHSLVLGGAVNGGDIYGQMPDIRVDSGDAVKGGRMIPTTSVDQYSATLARWFGLNQSELARVFPNLGNFSSSDIGFMG
ncbi:MAG: DUF1501 domain-containing protein [Granulosicoccus sp.]|nr:DUF1501 domain-containing protein [Granulosicoccus sp.]